MQKSTKTVDYRGLLLGIFVLGLVMALFVIPNLNSSKAGNGNKGLFKRTVSHVPGLEDYDIRLDKNASETIEQFRQESGTTASAIADFRDGFVSGENDLRSRVPTLKVDYSLDLRHPSVITPDMWKANIERLTSSSSQKRVDILKNFLKENNSLIGVTDEEVDNLRVKVDATNPNGYLSFVYLTQEINGVPVYRSELRAGFTKTNEMIRVLNDLAPGIDYNSASDNFGNPVDSVRRAFSYINEKPTNVDVTRNAAASTDLKTVFGEGDWATTAEKMYFPTEIGVVRPSWRVLIWLPVNAFYVIVDAETGKMLSRENITADQTESATYNVYTNPNAFINVATNPAPLSPGPLDPTPGTQGTNIARTNVTAIGNEAPNPGMNNLGWITDGTNITDGNNTEAGIDRVAPNGVDAPQTGSPNRVFDAPTWNPPPGSPAPGDDPLTVPAQRGAVIHMFYTMNVYHDKLYELGFTEAFENFQNDNFGRGGVAADRISSEGQDSSGTNNANFSTPADGGRGRMQMFLWDGPTPDYDGTADSEVIIHEVTHGTSTRLHNGLGNQGGMMGEGWSDWYGHVLLAQAADPINSINTTGGYATFQVAGLTTFTANYYYGIRKWPKAVKSFTGGPARPGCGDQPCPHNPLSFRHINAGCFTELGSSSTANISAFPMTGAQSVIVSATCSQVHNAGEIWSSALWEVRALMVQRLGFAAGTTRVLQVVTDGMKLAPANPDMLQERDAIIAAASALPAAPEAAADVVDVREGFRIRGMGFSASVQSATAVTEAFDSADLGASGTATVTSGNNLLEPNECNTLNVPLVNNSGNTATAISAVLSTTTPGVTITQPNSAYPDIPGGGGPVNNTTLFEVSVDNTVACFSNVNFTLTVTWSGAGGGSPEAFTFALPVGQAGENYNVTTGTGGTIPAGGTFITGSDDDDFVVTVPLPGGWTSTVYGTPVTSLSASTNGMMTVNGAAATTFTNTALPGAVGGASPTLFPNWDDMDMDAADVTGGGIFHNVVGTAPNRELYVEWRAQHFGETVNGPISTNFAIKLTEGSDVVQYIHVATGTGATANAASATVGIQKAATGTSFTQHSFNTSGGTTPGLVITLTRPPGVCSPGTGTCNTVPNDARADFDGDGKTDLAVFRPAEGNWYINGSTTGFGVINWGLSGDTLVPADYDGDGKDDTAVFRPDADPAMADFYVLNSNGFTFAGYSWGLLGDVPVVGDYDGDGNADVAIFRPSDATWYIINSGGGTTVTPFGTVTSVPVVGDFDGDGSADLTTFNAGTWSSMLSGGGTEMVSTGSAGDALVAGDYDGDGQTDQATFRDSDGNWRAWLSSTNSMVTIPFGTTGDIAVPGDYDGDGTEDQAIYRAGDWWVNGSTSGVNVQNFGLGSDTPVPSRANP